MWRAWAWLDDEMLTPCQARGHEGVVPKLRFHHDVFGRSRDRRIANVVVGTSSGCIRFVVGLQPFARSARFESATQTTL